jgi:AcrR family transcriptional regulator
MNIHSMRDELTKPVAILDAALGLFEARGYGATPVPLLADRAGVAAGTIYRYFPGKQGVVNALYQRWKGELAVAIVGDPGAAPLDPDAPAAETFVGVWRRLCAFVLAHPTAFAFLETHQHSPYLDDRSRLIGAQIDEAVESLLAAWQERGLVRPGDVSVLQAQVYGGLVGVVRLLRDRGRPLPDDLADQTVAAAWAVLSSVPLTPDQETQR